MVSNEATDPCFIIAEVGVNHDGDVSRALDLVDMAAETGADAVKFQTFCTQSLAAPGARKAAYQDRSSQDLDQVAMLKRLELAFDDFWALKKRAESHDLQFMSTPFDVESVRFLLDDMNLPRIKIGSGNLTDVVLLREIAQRQTSVILSTGMSTLDEVQQAVQLLQGLDLSLLHCTSSYPAQAEDANLKAMQTLQQHFGLPVGYSDHSQGYDLAMAAVAMGAQCIEKHLTYDQQAAGPDHAASSTPKQFKEMVDKIRMIEQALGDGVKRPRPSELDVRYVARKSVHLARDMAEGQIITAEDLVLLRPESGMSPYRLDQAVGRRLQGTKRSGEPLQEEDLRNE